MSDLKPLRVGWFIDTQIAEVAFEPPRPLRKILPPPHNPRAQAAICPAIMHHLGRLHCVCAPFSFCVSVRIGPASCSLLLNQHRSTIAAWKARDLLRLAQRCDWRYTNRPIVQLLLPYTFVTDDDILLRQLPPYLHYFMSGRPGTVLPGEFALRNWPRPLSWAFEWHDASQPLQIKRGEPLYYVDFEGGGERIVRLERIEKTPQIQQQQQRIGGVTAFMRNTLRLADQAGQGRAPQLLPPDETDPLVKE